MLVFVEGGKPENPEKNPRSRDENQQQTQPTYGTGPESNPGHIGGKRALSPLRHPCSPLITKLPWQRFPRLSAKMAYWIWIWILKLRLCTFSLEFHLGQLLWSSYNLLAITLMALNIFLSAVFALESFPTSSFMKTQ